MTDTRPTLNSEGFVCPRCNVWAHQLWSMLRSVGTSQFVDSREAVVGMSSGGAVVSTPGLPRGESGRWKTARCQHCDEASVWRDDKMMYPRSSTAPMPHADMPPEALLLYMEARDVVGLSPRAGAALARATLEKLLRVLDPDAPKGHDLKKRIDRMESRVSSPLWEMLTVIRHAGNGSLHVEDQPDDVIVLILDPEETEIVDLIFAAINDVVDELVTRPKRTRAVFEKVPQSVRDRIGKGATGASA